MAQLGNQLARQEAEEVALGIRALLATPLLSATLDSDTFDIVRRRQTPLIKWFDYHCGWRLTVESRQGYARLSKVASTPDHTRPARRLRAGRTPFDRRRYTLLCIAAAELLAGPATTIGLLADQIAQTTAADSEIRTFDSSRRDERSAFVDALKLLEHYGVVSSRDGRTDAYLDHAEAKVLYDVDTTMLLRLLAAPVAPSQVSTGSPDTAPLDALLVERRYGHDDATETQRNLWLRHSILRRLLDDPVVYRYELTDAQLSYLASPTGRRIVRQGVEQAGFVLEERSEGYLLVDTDAIATDEKFPDDRNHAKVAALLLLDSLVAAETPLTRYELTREASALLSRFPRWAKAYQDDDGSARLADEGIAVLSAFGLAADQQGLVTALPAAARYSIVRTGVREHTTSPTEPGDNS